MILWRENGHFFPQEEDNLDQCWEVLFLWELWETFLLLLPPLVPEVWLLLYSKNYYCHLERPWIW